MTRSIVMGSIGVARDPAGAVPVAFDTDRSQLVAKVKTGGRPLPFQFSDVQAVTASFTATAFQSGTTFIADSTTSVVVTLPAAATAPGMQFGLLVGQLTSAAGHSFDVVAADTIRGNGFAKAADAAVVCSAATDRVGDYIELVSDGVASWYVTSVIGTWA